MRFVFFPVIIVFLLTLKHHIERSGSQKDSQTFLEKENEANQTRKQDISHLPYIHIPIDSLPFHHMPKVTADEQCVERLSKEPVLNLNGITNTELKKMYGPSNLEFLSRCDENYTVLIRSLGQWGKCLYDNNLLSDAKCVLEYSVSIGSDISSSYQLLTDIYFEEQNNDALLALHAKAEALSSLSAPGILEYIETFL